MGFDWPRTENIDKTHLQTNYDQLDDGNLH